MHGTMVVVVVATVAVVRRVDVRGPWTVRWYDFHFEYKLQKKTKFEMRGRRLGTVTLGGPL